MELNDTSPPPRDATDILRYYNATQFFVPLPPPPRSPFLSSVPLFIPFLPPLDHAIAWGLTGPLSFFSSGLRDLSAVGSIWTAGAPRQTLVVDLGVQQDAPGSGSREA